MSIADALLPEFGREMATTRSLLERLPEARARWRPHPKSMPLGGLATHIANVLMWARVTLGRAEFDVNPEGGGGFPPPCFESTRALLATFDENARAAREALAAASDADMHVTWTLKNAGRPVFSMPRAAVLRAFVMNHLLHHRGPLSVYLRLLDVPLPPIYGPTADTPV